MSWKSMKAASAGTPIERIFFTAFLLCSAFLFAVWYLRRDGKAQVPQPSVFATVRAVLARRRKEHEAEHERARLAAGSAGAPAQVEAPAFRSPMT
jgi:hypothetical protein